MPILFHLIYPQNYAYQQQHHRRDSTAECGSDYCYRL